MRTSHRDSGGRVILVLGMHRSGTSTFTNCMVKAGLRIVDDVLAPDPDINPDGFFEDARVVALNEQLLALCERTWMDYRPMRIEPADARYLQWFQQALAHVRVNYSSDAHAVLKDPRLCRTWRHWINVFEEAGIEAHVVHIVRNPLDVAISLRRRDALPLDYGLLLWIVYVLAAADAVNEVPQSVSLTYESLVRAPRDSMLAVLHSLVPDLSPDTDFDSVVRRPLRSNAGEGQGYVSEDLEALAFSLYEKLAAGAGTIFENPEDDLAALRSQWEQLTAQFDHRCQALREAAEDLQDFSRRLFETGEQLNRVRTSLLGRLAVRLAR